jgi:hypothetical protein
MATAVEWYQKAIFEILKEKENLSDEIFLQNILNAHLQAKEMEKQQIIDANIQGFEDGINHEMDIPTKFQNSLQYYNETYKDKL